MIIFQTPLLKRAVCRRGVFRRRSKGKHVSRRSPAEKKGGGEETTYSPFYRGPPLKGNQGLETLWAKE